MSAVPEKEGYAFKGLYDAEEGGVQYTSSSGVSLTAYYDDDDIVLYPQFSIIEYTLILNYGEAAGGTSYVTAEYDGAIPSLPSNLYISGKSYMAFKGWYTEANCGGIQVAGSDGNGICLCSMDSTLRALSTSSNEITLYAGFALQTYTVTFYSVDGKEVLQTVTVEYGTDFAEVSSGVQKDGKGVSGWSLSIGYAAAYSGTIEYDLTVYAISYTITVTYNTNGGSEISAVTVADGESVTIPTPTRSGYNFLGWYDESGTQYSGTFVPTANITLTAVWSVFDGGNGTESSPYLISNAAEFAYITQYDGTGVYFKLTADIDLSSYSGPISTFNGNLDGGYHTISNWLYSVSTSTTSALYVGLISKLNGTVYDLNVSGFTVTVTSTGYGDINAGALAGINNGTIKNCIFTGNTINVTHEYPRGTDYYLKSFGGSAAGENAGTLQNSTAYSNYIYVASTSINKESDGKFWAKAGGLAGYNTGKMLACCAKNNSVTAYAAGGKVWTFTQVLLVADSGGVLGYNKGTVMYCFGQSNSLSASTKVASGSSNEQYKFYSQVIAQNNGYVGNCYCLTSDTVVYHNETSGSESQNSTVSSSSALLDIQVMVNNGWHDDDGEVTPTTR